MILPFQYNSSDIALPSPDFDREHQVAWDAIIETCRPEFRLNRYRESLFMATITLVSWKLRGTQEQLVFLEGFLRELSVAPDAIGEIESKFEETLRRLPRGT